MIIGAIALYILYPLLYYILLCVAVGMFAGIRRNRNEIGWFFLAILLTPLLAFIFVAILMPLPKRRDDANAGHPADNAASDDREAQEEWEKAEQTAPQPEDADEAAWRAWRAETGGPLGDKDGRRSPLAR
jgi:hypothetical protein